MVKPKRGHVGSCAGCREHAQPVRSYREDPEMWMRENDYGMRSLLVSGYSALKR
ncbi:MAG: hypothetical protein HXY34_06335 [Candidatus Thorarchaeota archaeon]|nr:hypothetical protein [Candidatus Thorarchaeota archaeon]